MIVLITPAEGNGGILQFSLTMLQTMVKLKRDVVLFAPNSLQITDQCLSQYIVLYDKVKTVNPHNSEIKNLANRILGYSPNLVLALEDSVLMQQLLWLIAQDNVSTAMVVHDVIAHPYYSMSFRQICVEFLRRLFTKKSIRRINRIVVLSNNSAIGFEKRYPQAKGKTICLTLGAHVPNMDLCEKPYELPYDLKGYALFFGRIDKYKGIDRLATLYRDNPDIKSKLVIAGKGSVPEKVTEVLRDDPRIYYINRFIQDGEMNYLYKYSRCVVLPYIEASQSGVLPIAYLFNKPVIISDLNGLKENVFAGKTGVVFRNLDELKNCIENIESLTCSDDIQKIYSRYYSWENNVGGLINALESIDD